MRCCVLLLITKRVSYTVQRYPKPQKLKPRTYGEKGVRFLSEEKMERNVDGSQKEIHHNSNEKGTR